jgi:transposase
MGAPKKADWREERRKRAWKLKEKGWQQKDIAAALGVSEGRSVNGSNEDEKEA